MKSYEEMIQFTIDQVDSGYLRYQEWTAYILLGEAYGKPHQEVCTDLKSEKDHREQVRQENRKAASRASNESRRLANLEKKNIGVK